MKQPLWRERHADRACNPSTPLRQGRARYVLRPPAMRAILAVLLIAGCGAGAGTAGSGGSRTAVIPMLSELPADPARRDAILDSANHVAGPEHRKGMTRRERKAESAAATAAAILGSAFSKTQNVTLGGATTFDENAIIAPHTIPVAPRPSPARDADEPKPSVPWIKLQ